MLAQYACTVCMHSMHAQYAGIVCMCWGWLLGRCDCNTCSECDERNEIHFVSSWGLVPSAGFLWLGSFALVPVASSLWLGSQEPLRPEPLLLIASQFCIPDTKPQIPLPLSWPEVKKCHRRSRWAFFHRWPGGRRKQQCVCFWVIFLGNREGANHVFFIAQC